MSERKVLNKYYPPDFDPTKIPRARQGKNKQFTVRLMAPCNMRCNTCGEYIYKGKKFNARKEDVENESYLGLRIYRFYIKCTRCIADICFKTDPASTDYIIEAGATRNFMALKLAEEQAEREEKAEKEDEATNPMKVLEKRTEASKHEMAVLEALEELKELNQRQVTPDFENMLHKYAPVVEDQITQQEDEDEAFVQSVFGSKTEPMIRRIEDDSSSSEDEGAPGSKKPMLNSLVKPTDFLIKNIKADPTEASKPENVNKEVSIGSFSGSKKMMLVKPKSSVPALPKSADDMKETNKSEPGSSTSINGGLSLLGCYGSGSSSDSD